MSIQESTIISQEQGETAQSSDKEKEIYFIISTPSEEKVNFDNLKFISDITPQIIYDKSIEKGNGSFIEHNIFKLNIIKKEKEKEKDKKSSTNYKLEYTIGEDSYEISFSVKENTFVYEPELKKGNKYIDNIVKESIDQDIISWQDKLDIFLEALEKNNETNKKEKLYEETITLYEKKKKFSLLISLFLKIYEENKSLCSKLLDTFKKINEKENTDRDKGLASKMETFKHIYEKADMIIENSGYDVINFYGILFCYLSSYDKDNFFKILKKFSEGNADILYEILITYYSHFKNPLNQNFEFYDNFIKYAIKKGKELKIFERILNYIDDIEAFLYVINENKVDIFKKYDDLKRKPIELASNLKLVKRVYNEDRKEKKEIDIIIDLIQEIIKFSKDNQILVVYLKSSFWVYLLKQYNKPDLEYIDNCNRLRELFKTYNNLINILYKGSNNKNELTIKNDINRYNDRDEFAFNLNNNIKELFEIKKDKYNDEQKLGIIKKYNPYYNNENKEDEDKYQNLRQTDIFNDINFKNPTIYFKESFHLLNFEAMFKENIREFINKITSKIEDIDTFGTIMEIIDTTRIEKEKKEDYYNILKDKYELIIKNQIQLLKEETELKKAVEIISDFISRIFLYEENTNFLEEKISKLDDKIKSLIYNELMKRYNDKKFEKMKEYIFDIFLSKIEDIDNIIKLIDSLSNEDKNKFLDKLLKKCDFDKEEYYSNLENKKIKLICYLNEAGKLDINNIGNLQNTLDEIKNDLEKGLISKKKLEEFLYRKKKDIKNVVGIKEENKEKKEKEEKEEKNEQQKNVQQKLGLIKLVINDYDPIKSYGELKKTILDINKKITDLDSIKNSLIIFHRNTYNREIRDLTNIINEIETKPIKDFRSQSMKVSIDNLLKLKATSDEIYKVKDFLLFKKIFEKAQGKDQADRFKDALDKLNKIKSSIKNKSEDNSINIEIIFKEFENIFKNIKEELSKEEESKSDKFIEQMIDYFNIKDDEEKENMKIIIKSKKYEMDVKSIKFFFENFSNKKLTLPKNIDLSTMKLEDLKRTLNKLKNDNIYDYESNSFFYKVFTSFYDKKEAIDFLIKKINTNMDNLKDKLDPTNRSISIKDIDDAFECLNQFKQLIDLNSSEIIGHLKELDEETIKKFVSYSKHYPSIIELDRKNEKDIFENIYTIIENASLTFRLDNEYFCYKSNDNEKKDLGIKDLIELKNKINIQFDNKKKNEEKSDEDEVKDLYRIKCDKLVFFKNTISDLEVIYNKIKILRTKGYNIPILINISIEYPNIIYKFKKEDEENKDFEFIKNFLFTIKNDYESQLNTIYKNEKHSRFLYGKLFRKIKLHQEGNYEVKEIIRYILNKIDYKDKVLDGEPFNVKIGEDWETEFKDYTKQIFNNMSKYIISLFEKNGLNFEKHYENMLIKGDKKYKGIYKYKCNDISMEEYILYLFQEKLEKLPIAQNILICSNETSIEEMQSFFYRAILCDYNTLFVIEVLESFSNFQHNKMYSYIDKLLSYKLEKYKKEHKENKNINKLNTREYLNSCIFFVYKKLDEETAFNNELGKYTIQRQVKMELPPNETEKDNTLNNLNISDISNNSFHSKMLIQDNVLLENIKVFSSDVCGLGKSFQIKKKIKENKEIYYHFPLGGKLSKKVIYKKLLELLKRIKKDIKKDINKKDEEDENDEEYIEYNNVAIHVDLIETEETPLISEFLLSFLITKFYNNNEDIIYIPNNLKIYIEIPNSFEKYLSKIGILNIFKIENISLKKLPKLELDRETQKIFERMIGKETDEQIEEFIKKNIGIPEYSYHQVKTFINLFISQFSIFDEKIKFKNSKDDDITNKCIEYFAESTKYFTNGGFARIIMDKKQKIKDKIDLCLDAYENDINKGNFKSPLIFIDKSTKKWKLEILPDIKKEQNEDINNIKTLYKEVDITYLIDATGSMGREIKAANDYVIQIFDELRKNYKDFNFRFGAVFYRDKIDSEGDENEYFPLTDDMEKLKNKISKIKPYGGADIPEDWVEGYKLALNKMNWRNGIKLIIHIADAGAHGTDFSKEDKHEEQGPLLYPLIKECAQKNINIIGFKIGKEPEQSFEKIAEIYNNYKMSNKDEGQFIEIFDFIRGKDTKKGEKDPVSENFHNLVLEAAHQVVNPSYKFLKRLKNILNLPNDLEKDIGDKKSLLSILNIGTDNYVITDDNYKKMVLLIYRIKSNVPVIIMGETGCGKTSLIIKLSQILNNGEKLVEIININPGITDEEICKKMKEINEKAKKQEYINKEKNEKKELWVFFDEINTCLSLSLLTEIFINRAFNGEKLEDNIRLCGACNPYRRRKLTAVKCGLTREDDKDDDLVYKVEQLPQSLLYYVFSFGSIKDEDEKKYIRSIIQKIFSKEEENLHNLTTEAISKCHIFLRKIFQDPSIVSLREIARFTKCVEFFQDYFLKKNNQNKFSIDDDTKKLYKIKSIICSIYSCYYIRLVDDEIRGRFDAELQKILLKIVNVYSNEESNDEGKSNLFDRIKNTKLKDELNGKNIESFSDLLKIEEEFLLEQIELAPSIGKNQLLKENIFLLFLAVVTKIPLIIVGKPGTGKSLSAQLINNSMKGKYSKNSKDGKPGFFKKYPPIIQKYFQGSESTSPEDVTELFQKTENLYKNYLQNKNEDDVVPIYMILFDELGLAEKSPTNPLKVLHSKLEYDGKKEGVCFIGISNYSLDAAKINRALSLSVPNLEDKPEQLRATAKSIVKSISEDISKDTSKIFIFNIISRAYHLYKWYLNFIKKLTVLKKYIEEKPNLRGKDLKEIEREQDYKKLLQKNKTIKTEFHGNRDFYNIIKGVATEGAKLNNISDEIQIVPKIENFIERNFGGINYEIDIDFNLQCNDIIEDMQKLKDILKEKLLLRKTANEKIKVTSVYLFKKIYNEACNNEDNKKDNIKGVVYKIKDENMDKYDLNKCINDNINDNNSRYLLLEIKSNLAPLINQIINVQNPDKKEIDFINGSPFSDDNNNNEYKTKKVGEIQNCASKQDKLIILQNLNPIQPYLYDLYNMNYKIIDEQKYVRICLNNFSEDLTPVNDTFRIIILVDRKFVNEVDMAFLNRLEKMQIRFKDLLNNEQKNLINAILEKTRLKEEIKKVQNSMNYDLNQLLINCGEQEIGGLVYYLSIENKKENINEDNIKERIYRKISNLLPQDIITNLPEENPIKNKYYSERRYNNFKEYIQDLESARQNNINNYKISIIYTFSSIANTIEGFDVKADKTDKIMISEIRTEDKFKNDIDDIKSKNKDIDEDKHIILINFEQYNSNKIQFICDYINNYCKEDDDYNYILIIHIQRSFDIGKSEIIYSIPNIYKNINQIFIDNLQGPNLSLRDILKKNIKDVMFSADTFKNLDKEFNDSLINFVYEEMKEKSKNNLNEKSMMSNFSNFDNYIFDDESIIKEEKYSEELKKYMAKDIEFKNDLIKKAKELIELDNDAQGHCQSLVDKMLKNNYINKNSIDIISCILDYIKENIFKKYLLYIFKVLEDNNFLTTLIEISKDRNSKLDKNDKSNKNERNKFIIKELKNKFLKEIKVDNDAIYEPKFLFNYKIPGFYKFYDKLSDYLNKNIASKFFNNEKKLRDYFETEPEKAINKFHEKEIELLDKVLDIIRKDTFYFDLINKITPDLILKDYITFYLGKYIGTYNKSYSKIIELLLNLRYSENISIIKDNLSNPINIIFLKIIWIESNTNYITSILNVFKIGKDIVNDKDGIEFNQKIYDLIYDEESPIQYLVDEERNPEFTREVNESFYKLLAGLCLSVTSKDIKLKEITIGNYCGKLKDINKILQNMNHELNIYLNEIYIIDELIKIIEYELDKGIKSIENIEDIRENLVENSKIIQKNRTDKISNLIKNFIDLNKKFQEEKDDEFKTKYYYTFKYIYSQEIKKVNEITYRAAILGELMKEKDIIKNSNDILQILLEFYVDKKYFKDTKDELLKNKKDVIVKLIDKYLSNRKVDYYLALSETLIYFFEKNSLNYLKYFLKKNSLKAEPLTIFKGCAEFLNKLKKDASKFHDKCVNITKLFCLAYIKAFCYTFIKLHEDSKFNPEEIIKEINECDKIKMVKLYIYKIIYNQNNKQIDILLKNDTIDKYKLNKYDNFSEFIKGVQLNYENNNDVLDNDNYKNVYKVLCDYQKDNFQKEIAKEDIKVDGKLNFDDFFMAANNLILLKLKRKDFESEQIYINFYNNVCEPLYKSNDDEEESNKLLILLQFLFESEKYVEIKKEYEINPKDIEVILYGYRYCLNEISEKNNDEEEDYIYSSLYDINNLNYLDEKFYPGSDTKEEPYYELYNKIQNHFKERPNQGCYVCLCTKGYYHSVTSGFPGYSEVKIKCPNCGKDIGAKEMYEEEKDEKDNKVKLNKVYETIYRDDYVRIFKDKDEIDKIKKNMAKYYKLQKMNYITIEEFKTKYIKPLYNRERGLNQIDKSIFKKENKTIRNLSQLSYRLLNYILYSHLFFAKLFTGSEQFDNYLPKGLSWFNTIKECFNLLQKELEKKGIKQVEIFLNFVFKDLFNKLHNKECIKNYEDLIKFENELEKLIQDKFSKVKEKIDKYKELERKYISDKTSGIALLKEIYNKDNYDPKKYPYYEHFYYTDYLDEEYIDNIIEFNEYPILSKYLEHKKHKKKKKDNNEKYSLEYLDTFNKVLNLFNDKYSNQITREYAEKTLVKNCDIYAKNHENKEIIDEFIQLYNRFGIEESNGEGKKEKLKLNIDKNCIIDFLLLEDNKFGKSYKKIYDEFVKKQNEELENLLDKKIDMGIFNNNCKNKINIQQLKENEIFTFDIPKKFNFFNVLCNSSYRKVIDTDNYENYNDYVIHLDSTESEMTELLLKNKKLLNNELEYFNFNNEAFTYEINDLISNFKYGDMEISNKDKLVIYDYITLNDGNNEIYKKIINNFITLIEYLNKAKNEDNNIITENTKIYEIDIVKNGKNIEKDFQDIFKDQNDLIVSKIPNLFKYYLNIIFRYIKKDIEKYQEKKEIKKPEDKKEKNKKEKQNISLDEETIQKLDKIFEEKDMIIQKDSLASAIRLFISLVLYREEEKDKDKKIKSNKRNVIEYLKGKDLWETEKNKIYNDIKFEENLDKIKSLNIKIKEILWLYYYLTNNKDEGFENEIKEYKKQLEEEKMKIEKQNDKLDSEEEEEKGNRGKIRRKKEEDSDDDNNDDDDEDDDDDDDDDDNKNRRKRNKKGRRRNDSDSDSD